MSAFSALNLFKSSSKSAAKQQGLQLADARERLSIHAGFSSFHDLHTVADKSPEDVRLLRCVFGVNDYESVVMLPHVFDEVKAKVTKLALLNIDSPTAYQNMLMDDPYVSCRYQSDTGVLIVLLRAGLKGVTKEGFTQTAEWWSALVNFEVKFREGQWSLVPSSVDLRMMRFFDDVESDEDVWFEDLPSSEFWG